MVFDMSFLVRSADPAEVMLEQIVALQSEELPRRIDAALADDPSHRDAAVVVTDPPGNAAEELERPAMAFRWSEAMHARRCGECANR